MSSYSTAVVADHFLVKFNNKSAHEINEFLSKNNLKIRRKLLEESSYIITFEDFSQLAEKSSNSAYGKYLKEIAKLS